MKRSFGVGWVLQRSLAMWAKQLPVLLPFVAIAWGLVILGIGFGSGGGTTDDVTGQMTAWPFAFWICNLVFGAFGDAAITYRVAQELRGEPVSLGAALGRGLRRFIPTLWMNAVVLFCIAVGASTFFVPAVFIYALFYLAVPASVVERPGTLGSLNRSNFLTDGYKLRILLMAALLGVLWFAVNYAMFRALGLHDLGKAMGDGRGLGDDDRLSKTRIFLVLSLGWHILFGLLQATVAAVTYATLRDQKDGTSSDELGQVFA
jgi:hypothetical protein